MVFKKMAFKIKMDRNTKFSLGKYSRKWKLLKNLVHIVFIICIAKATIPVASCANLNKESFLMPTIDVLCRLHPIDLNEELNNNEDLFGLSVKKKTGRKNSQTRGQRLSFIINSVEIICINNNSNVYLLDQVKSYAIQLHKYLESNLQKAMSDNSLYKCKLFNYKLLLKAFYALRNFATNILYCK